MELVSCALCNSNKTVTITNKGRNLEKVRFIICRICGLIYLNPRMTEDEYKNWYSDGTYAARYRKSKRIERYANNQIEKGKRIYGLLGPFLNHKHQTVFEIGSTSGGILKYFKDQGFGEVLGIDPEMEYVDYANTVFKVPTIHGILNDYHPDRSFNIIIMRHVLEHMLDPVGQLVKIRSMLESNGILYLEIPNLYSLNLRKGWFFNFYLGHPYVFTPKTIKAVVYKAGFTILYESNSGYRRDISLILRQSKEQKNDISRYYEDWRHIILRGYTYHLTTPARNLYILLRKLI